MPQRGVSSRAVWCPEGHHTNQTQRLAVSIGWHEREFARPRPLGAGEFDAIDGDATLTRLGMRGLASLGIRARMALSQENIRARPGPLPFLVRFVSRWKLHDHLPQRLDALFRSAPHQMAHPTRQ